MMETSVWHKFIWILDEYDLNIALREHLARAPCKSPAPPGIPQQEHEKFTTFELLLSKEEVANPFEMPLKFLF